MAVFLTEDWSGGDFSQWVDVPYEMGLVGSPFLHHNIRTIDGAPAFTCSWGQNQFAYIGQEIGAQGSGLNAVTVRMRMCFDVDAVAFGSPNFIDIFAANGFPSWSSGGSPNFQAYGVVDDQGRIFLRLYDNVTPTEYASASGVIPLDGTEVAIQISRDSQNELGLSVSCARERLQLRLPGSCRNHTPPRERHAVSAGMHLDAAIVERRDHVHRAR
jgi:hypothetical protein